MLTYSKIRAGVVTVFLPMFISALSGCVWALLVSALIDRAFTWPLWVGLAASPAIGLVMGFASYRFHERPIPEAIGVALLTLHVAAAMFGGALDVATWIWSDGFSAAGPPGPGIGMSGAAGMVMGLMLSGYVLVLAPLAFFNHTLVGHAWEEGARQAR